MAPQKLFFVAIIATILCLNFANGANDKHTLDFLRHLGRKPLPSKVSTLPDAFDVIDTLIFKWGTGLVTGTKFLNFLFADYEAPLSVHFVFESEENGFTEQISIGGHDDDNVYTTVTNGHDKNDAQIEFGVSNFTYRYSVPELIMNSTDFQRISTNTLNQNQVVWNGLVLSMKNLNFALETDFKLENGAFSVSNLALTFDFGEISLDIPSVLERVDGEWSDLGELYLDVGPMFEELLGEIDDNGRTIEENYEAHIEEQLNDFLSGN